MAVLAEPVPVANVLVPHIREMAHSAGMSPTSAARNHDANRARPAGRPKAKRTYQVVPGYAPGVAAPKTYALWTPDPGVRTLWTP